MSQGARRRAARRRVLATAHASGPRAQSPAAAQHERGKAHGHPGAPPPLSLRRPRQRFGQPPAHVQGGASSSAVSAALGLIGRPRSTGAQCRPRAQVWNEDLHFGTGVDVAEVGTPAHLSAHSRTVSCASCQSHVPRLVWDPFRVSPEYTASFALQETVSPPGWKPGRAVLLEVLFYLFTPSTAVQDLEWARTSRRG